MVFLCAGLFTVVWWNVPHTRSSWMITFVVLVGVSVIIGLYRARGVAHVIRRFFNQT